MDNGYNSTILKEFNNCLMVVPHPSIASIFGLGKGIRIVGPERVKEKTRAVLAEISARYED